jgi:metal-responsive CopG/Arc/MetJ family transcriptional regulator
VKYEPIALKLPEDLLREMDAAIARGPEQTRSAFIRDAIRDKISACVEVPA